MPEMLALRDTDPRQVSVYRLLGRLGEGGQGVVFLAEGPTGNPAAVERVAAGAEGGTCLSCPGQVLPGDGVDARDAVALRGPVAG